MLGVFMAVLAVVSPTFAQDVCADIEANTALYEEYTKNFKGTLEQKKTAVKAGNEYIQKYAACADYEPQITYLKRAVPTLEKTIAEMEAEAAKQKRYARFNAAVPAGNAAEIFASGEDILKYEPEFIEIIIVLASVGLDEAAVKQNDTFNSKAISFAKSAIKKIEGGKTSDTYGLFGWEYKTKENALGWMNYTIGYIEYYRLNSKESGLNYLYKATQMDSEVKDRDFIYVLMGERYAAKAEALNKEIVEIIKAEEKETFESKTKFALSKGYVDRAIEAFAKGYEVAKANMSKETDAAKKTEMTKYVDGLFNTLKTLYKFRYETVEEPLAEPELVQQLNSHIAAVSRKPLPSPTSEVQPVDPPTEEEEETTDSTTTSLPTTTTTTPAKTETNGTDDKTTAKPKQP